MTKIHTPNVNFNTHAVTDTGFGLGLGYAIGFGRSMQNFFVNAGFNYEKSVETCPASGGTEYTRRIHDFSSQLGLGGRIEIPGGGTSSFFIFGMQAGPDYHRIDRGSCIAQDNAAPSFSTSDQGFLLGKLTPYVGFGLPIFAFPSFNFDLLLTVGANIFLGDHERAYPFFGLSFPIDINGG
ncbi:MAG: hypothetical protein IT573_01185 [Deltaproteobacteria bacterium]|nr:hypothetical protein [Deltaproteobacteria bacterium]